MAETPETPGYDTIRVNKGGTATFEPGKPKVSQKDLDTHLQEITTNLHGIYLNLVNGMESFQHRWDGCGGDWIKQRLQIFGERAQGLKDGFSEWVVGLGDLIDPESWKEIIQQGKEAVGAAGEWLEQHAVRQYESIKERFKESKSGSCTFGGSTLLTMCPESISESEANDILNPKAIWERSKAIAELSEILSSGDGVGFVNFVDNVVSKIDPKLAEEISTGKNAYIYLVLMTDPDSILTFQNYVALMHEAIPPNFGAYALGMSGGYLTPEILLTCGLAALSEGSAGVARVTTLAGRLRAVANTAKAASEAASLAKNVAKAQRLRKAALAIEALIETILGLYHVAQKFRKHAVMLYAALRGLSLLAPPAGAPSGGDTDTDTDAKRKAAAEAEELMEKLKGKTELETDPQPDPQQSRTPPIVPVRRKTETRDKKDGCKICGSPNHKTPNYGGSLEREEGYRKKIEDNTMKEEHPRHQGVEMAAHHVISVIAGRKLNEELKADLVRLGYDINILSNLAFIPSTLKGACHLGVQPHVSGHTLKDETGEPIYHSYVRRAVSVRASVIIKECCPSKAAVEKLMESVSEDILDKIQKSPVLAPLSSAAKHFVPGYVKGCGNVESVTAHKGDKCRLNFNHLAPEGTAGIKYPKQPYTLKLGE